MILILFAWLFTFSVVFTVGYGVHQVLFNRLKDHTIFSADQYFFLGFVVLALFSAWLSIFTPINSVLLIGISLSCLIFWIIKWRAKKIAPVVELFLPGEDKKHTLKLISVIMVALAILASLEIVLYDTGLYHAQCIQWIRNFPVLPGLGNIHGRIAFNSMFFPISALFTIDIFSGHAGFPVLIYPLNGVVFGVLLVKLGGIVFDNFKLDKIWAVILVYSILFLAFMFLRKNLHSPAPDLVCAGMIVYVFILYLESVQPIKESKYILIAGLVFTCIIFKLSALFLFLILLPILWTDFTLKKIGFTIVYGLAFVFPFLIRNYYLSGYLVYPFPSIDLFVVDWKIPLAYVEIEKALIISCARITCENFDEYNRVLQIPFKEWIVTWFQMKSALMKLVIALNALSLLSILILATKKKHFRLMMVQIVIFLNLVFWFLNAPEHRFAYGFLIFGAAITLTSFYLVLPFARKILIRQKVFIGWVLSLIPILLLSFWYIKDYRNTSMFDHLLIPAGLPAIELQEVQTNFTYTTPKIEDELRCNNAPIPCSPNFNEKLVLRGKTIKEGFKIQSEENRKDKNR